MRNTWVLKVYVALWGAWFRWGRLPASRIFNRLRPRLKQADFPTPPFETLKAFASWWSRHARWVPDPLGGALDVVASWEHALWQLHRKGVFEDDCDGLAYVGAQFLRRIPGVDTCYIVTLLLDPYEFPSFKTGVYKGAHVLCIFRYRNTWRVLSNDTLYPESWSSFEDALHRNPFCEGHRIIWYEVRDADMRRLNQQRVV